MMVEGEANEISEDEFLEAIKFAHKHIAELCAFQKEFAKEAGKQKRALLTKEDHFRNDSRCKESYAKQI